MTFCGKCGLHYDKINIFMIICLIKNIFQYIKKSHSNTQFILHT
ncbi:hypothetical protein TREAZ_1056 [Leadbettera azotonutricia ZAS-9]|uniref:Uncharacterized protein n=1 Tax=Leadbettera azotonutricia (strain ATCC BAA-888 / DSM 13862 / ZAS-9) TaxID=545695 RepID=F5Y7M3_LEAAZ|nr:hypothetical protein TREAZ_1056 [Leadbettera azotonutricia ZAS-9]